MKQSFCFTLMLCAMFSCETRFALAQSNAQFLAAKNDAAPSLQTGAMLSGEVVEAWKARLDEPENSTDVAQRIFEDHGGGIYVAAYNRRAANAPYALVLVKYDRNGCEKWRTRYDGPSWVSDLIGDDKSNLYLTGYGYVGGRLTDFVTLKLKTTTGKIYSLRVNL